MQSLKKKGEAIYCLETLKPGSSEHRAPHWGEITGTGSV